MRVNTNVTAPRNTSNSPTPNIIITSTLLNQGCTSLECHFAGANTFFFTLSPNVGEFSVRMSLYVTIPALKILRWLLYFQKQKRCATVFQTRHEFLSTHDHPHNPDIRRFLLWRDVAYCFAWIKLWSLRGYCILCIVYFMLYSVHFIFYIVYFMLYIMCCILYILYCILYILYCIVYILYCILYILYCIVYVLYCILYILYCILCIVYFILYILYWRKIIWDF